MHSPAVENVIAAVRRVHGSDRVRYYGSDPSEEHGVCFKIAGIAASISVHTQGGDLADGLYDVQVEGEPPGEYVYVSVMSLSDLMTLIEQLRLPTAEWPLNAA